MQVKFTVYACCFSPDKIDLSFIFIGFCIGRFVFKN